MFVIRVHTGQEKRFVRSLNREGYYAYAPEMTVVNRKSGRWHEKVCIIFNGYVFFETETVTAETFQRIRSLPFFINFLSYENPLPITEEQYVKLLAENNGICIGRITDGKITITGGQLAGIEHRILRYNKRQRKVKAELTLYGKPYEINCSVDIASSD